MEEIPTAEEFLARMKKMQMPIPEIMKGFAKRHTKAALKEVVIEIDNIYENNLKEDVYINEEDILLAYPLENIK